ncbi:MAG: helix-turn-helix domain-containing protein [Negativicutes bacterium]
MAIRSYGPLLGKIRRTQKIKAEIIARKLGISPSTYSQIETGRRSASYERVAEICGELGLTLSQLDEMLDADSSEERKGTASYEEM